METTSETLIEAVDNQRIKRQMSDRKFSMQVLGVSPSYWCLLKAGKRRPTLNLLMMLVQNLPEVAPEVTVFVMRQGNNGRVPESVAQSEGGTASLGQLSTPTKGRGKKT